jgi:hypothetical protein
MATPSPLGPNGPRHLPYERVQANPTRSHQHCDTGASAWQRRILARHIGTSAAEGRARFRLPSVGVSRPQGCGSITYRLPPAGLPKMGVTSGLSTANRVTSDVSKGP